MRSLSMQKKSLSIFNLIQNAKEGDEMAFSELFNLYWKDIYLFIISKSVSKEDAEDFCILSFSKAFTKINQFNETKNFKSWMFKIAQNCIYDDRRKQEIKYIKKTSHTDSNYFDLADITPSKDLTPEEKFINQQNLSIVKNKIKMLPMKYRIVVELRFIQEKKYNEISNEIGIPLSTVKVLLFRARNLLTSLLNNND